MKSREWEELHGFGHGVSFTPYAKYYGDEMLKAYRRYKGEENKRLFAQFFILLGSFSIVIFAVAMKLSLWLCFRG